MPGTSTIRLLSILVVAAGLNAWGGSRIFNVLDYGAHHDGSALATEAFRAAIQAAHAAGGGTVEVPAGEYITGPIELVSNLELHLEAGATLRFPAMRLPYGPGRQQGVECLTPAPLIGGRKLENVSITGRGLLTTNQADWLNLMGRPEFHSDSSVGAEFGPAWNKLLGMLELKQPVPQDLYKEVAPFLRPSFVRLMDSRNILVEGLHFVGSPMWTVHLLYSENAVVRDLIVETYPGAETDGLVVDSSRNVRISNCYFDTGDDALVLKSGKDADGLRVNRPTEGVSIVNCTFHHAHGAVTLGSETSGWIRNVTASNIVCDGTQIGIRVKSRRGRGGGVEDVRFDQWTMDHVGQGISVTNYYLMAGETRTSEEAVSDRTPIFRNIGISHVSIAHARVAIDVEGLPEMPIEGLRITDVTASGKIGLKSYHTVALALDQVQVDAQNGPAFLLRDSKDLQLNGVATRKPVSGMPVIRLDHCPRAVVSGSRAFPSTGTFLSVAPGELKEVVMVGNALEPARKAAEESAKDFPMVAESATEKN